MRGRKWRISLGSSFGIEMGDDRLGGVAPVHTVTVSAFAMDKWEVSIELWESVRAWGNTHGYDLIAGGVYGTKHPVQSVNWFDVVKWCNARSEKNGKLPAYYEDYERLIVYRTGIKFRLVVGGILAIDYRQKRNGRTRPVEG